MTFECKVYWEMCGVVRVEAGSPKEAALKAQEMEMPKEREYVQDSANCDPETDVQEVT